MINKRRAIKKVLEDEFTVYDIGILDKDAYLSLPFVVLSIIEERHLMRSHFITFSVYVYASIKTPLILDDCEKKIKMLLHKKRIKSDEGAFFVEYTGTTLDFINMKINAEMGALAKVIEFKIPLI